MNKLKNYLVATAWLAILVALTVIGGLLVAEGQVNPQSKVMTLFDRQIVSGQTVDLAALDVEEFRFVSFLASGPINLDVDMVFAFSTRAGELTDRVPRLLNGACEIGAIQVGKFTTGVQVQRCRIVGGPIIDGVYSVGGPFLLVRLINNGRTGSLTLEAFLTR